MLIIIMIILLNEHEVERTYLKNYIILIKKPLKQFLT